VAAREKKASKDLSVAAKQASEVDKKSSELAGLETEVCIYRVV